MPDMTRVYTIHERLWPECGPNPYRIIENINTVDGVRSRLTHQSFATFEAALAYIERISNADK